LSSDSCSFGVCVPSVIVPTMIDERAVVALQVDAGAVGTGGPVAGGSDVCTSTRASKSRRMLLSPFPTAKKQGRARPPHATIR
jgi:hypothetical protein